MTVVLHISSYICTYTISALYAAFILSVYSTLLKKKKKNLRIFSGNIHSEWQYFIRVSKERVRADHSRICLPNCHLLPAGCYIVFAPYSHRRRGAFIYDRSINSRVSRVSVPVNVTLQRDIRWSTLRSSRVYIILRVNVSGHLIDRRL